MENEIISESIVRQAFPNSISAVILEEFNLSPQMILRLFLLCDNYIFYPFVFNRVELVWSLFEIKLVSFI